MVPRRQYWLRSDTLQDILDRHHLSHLRFADHIGYWSQLLHRRRPLSPNVRRDLLASRYLRGIPEDHLWEVGDGPQ